MWPVDVVVLDVDAQDTLELAAAREIRNRIGLGRSGSDQASCRAFWVVQRPSGLALQPARCTRRLLSSRKKSTYRRRSGRRAQAVPISRLPYGVPGAGRTGPCVRVGRGGLEAVRPRRGGYALARVFSRVTLAAPADGVRMLVCPSSQQTRTRGGCSWSTSSITPARLGCATFSDSTMILSPA
jgi:hypothetical protein